MPSEYMTRLMQAKQIRSQQTGKEMGGILEDLNQGFDDQAYDRTEAERHSQGGPVDYRKPEYQTSEMDKWNQQINAMSSSQNEDIRKQGMGMMNSQLSKAASDQSDSGKTGALTWEQYNALSPDQQTKYDRYNRFQAPASIQKSERLLDAESPEEFAMLAKTLGMDNFLDLGDSYFNSMLEGQPASVQKVFRKNLQATKAKEKIGLEQGTFVSNFRDDMSRSDEMYNDIDFSIEVLNEMSGITDYSTTGFASWIAGVPTTDANEWRGLRDTMTSRLGLDKLMELKEGSATGSSGLGALSEKELYVLQTYVSNLNQANTPGKIKKEMRKLYGQLERTQKKLRSKQGRAAERYNELAPQYTADLADTSPWDDYTEEDTADLGTRRSAATSGTPKLTNKPFSPGELIPTALQKKAEGGYKIGQVYDGYEYVGGPTNDPSSYREVK